MISISIGYIPTRTFRHAICLALLPFAPALTAAGTVYQWTDAEGMTHFSDSAPPQKLPDLQEFETASPAATSVRGLRPGERASLHNIERQLAQRRRTARQVRQSNDHAVAERRRNCRERRARQRGNGYHATRKAEAIFLRRHCW